MDANQIAPKLLFMSHYDAVLPIRFEVVRDQILPQWLDVLDNQLSLRDFAAKWSHLPSRDELMFGQKEWEYQFKSTQGYTDWFRSRPLENWLRRQVPTPSPSAWFSDEFLALALLNGASALLPPTPEDPFPSNDSEIYYGRSHNPPFALVAGTKNRFYFLEAFFSHCHDEGQRYNSSSCHRKTGAPPEICDLLERLFFGERVLPGTSFLARSPAWRSSDDPYFAGFLVPDETARLAELLPLFDQPLSEDQQADDTLFPLFKDRVQRAAQCKAGLVTLFGML